MGASADPGMLDKIRSLAAANPRLLKALGIGAAGTAGAGALYGASRMMNRDKKKR